MWREIAVGLNRSVLGINRRNIDYVYHGNSRRYFHFLDRKLETKKVLESAGLPYPETLAVYGEFSELASLGNSITAFENFVIKPNKGRGGSGILVLGKRSGSGFLDYSGRQTDIGHIRKRIADILFGVYSFGMSDSAIIEKRIFPHRFFRDIYDYGLADIRIISYYNEPVMAMLRLPSNRSGGKANLHQGGIGVGIDIESGVTVRAIHRGKPVDIHPDSGNRLLGLSVPYFSEMKKMCKKFPETVPLKYLGFDFVVDAAGGPLVLEINARPGLEIQNANGVGLLDRLEEQQR